MLIQVKILDPVEKYVVQKLFSPYFEELHKTSSPTYVSTIPSLFCKFK